MRRIIIAFCCLTATTPSFALLGGLFDSGKKEVEVVEEPEAPLVQAFDIAGITLGATHKYVMEDWLTETEYKLMKSETKIPDYFEYNYNYECRRAGNKTPMAIETCIKMYAGKNKKEYVHQMNLKRLKTGEEIEIYFTSNETENVVYKIKYKNDVNELEGIGVAYQYQKQEKIRNFWAATLEKYGQPNLGQQVWASDPTDEKKPVLRAYYGQLVLEHLELFESDIAKSQTEAQLKFKTKKYSF